MKHYSALLLINWAVGCLAWGSPESSDVPRRGCCRKTSSLSAHAVRKPGNPVDELFISRWSPRAMSGEMVSTEDLMSMFEAARWAPSTYNDQPWLFVYSQKESQTWSSFLDLLVDFNKSWAQHAGALVVVIARDTFEKTGKANSLSLFDVGAAVQNFSLQGFKLGLVVHSMGGFDRERAATFLGVPQGYTVVAMVAVGKPGDLAVLPPEIREMEKPSDRKPTTAFVFEGVLIQQ